MIIPIGDDVAGALFDFDGTLVDSRRANYEAMAAALAKYGLDMPEEWFYARTGISSAEMIELFATGQGVRSGLPVPEIVRDRDKNYLRRLHLVRPHAVVSNTARWYRDRLPIAVASGGSRPIIVATIAATGLAGVFDVLVTIEDVLRGKPQPDLFLRAANLLDVPPARCVVFEDSDEGALAAHRAGMQLIDVRPYTLGDPPT